MKGVIIIVISCFLISPNIVAQQTIDDYKATQGIIDEGQKLPLKDYFKEDKSKASYKETCKWIIQKMNAYVSYEYIVGNSPDASYFYSNKYKLSDCKVSIDSPILYIKQTVNEEDYSRDRFSSIHPLGESSKSTYTQTVGILISDLKRVNYGFGWLEFETFDNSIFFVKEESTKPNYGNKYKFYMTFDKEDNIDERLIKAFIHLNRFHWKKVGKETF